MSFASSLPVVEAVLTCGICFALVDRGLRIVVYGCLSRSGVRVDNPIGRRVDGE
jgi:hypothetical protein